MVLPDEGSSQQEISVKVDYSKRVVPYHEFPKFKNLVTSGEVGVQRKPVPRMTI